MDEEKYKEAIAEHNIILTKIASTFFIEKSHLKNFIK